MNILSEYTNELERYKKYPFSRLAFITIRCPTQKSKWTKISTIRTWIRRYSDNYIIVRGAEGGIHFHLLAGIEIYRKVKPQKGIHFHIKYLTDQQKEFFPDTFDESELKRKASYYKNQKYEELTLDLHVEGQCIISQLNAMIKAYWKTKNRKTLTKKKLTLKEMKYLNVVKYLQKNLNEHKDPELYTDLYVASK